MRASAFSHAAPCRGQPARPGYNSILTRSYPSCSCSIFRSPILSKSHTNAPSDVRSSTIPFCTNVPFNRTSTTSHGETASHCLLKDFAIAVITFHSGVSKFERARLHRRRGPMTFGPRYLRATASATSFARKFPQTWYKTQFWTKNSKSIERGHCPRLPLLACRNNL